MKENSQFSVYALKGYVDLETLSPLHNVFYQIREINEPSMGNWCCKIRFLDIQNRIIYFKNDRYAHSLLSEKFKVVIWSSEGNSALLSEYKRNEVHDLVLLDFEEMSSYRLSRDDHQALLKQALEDDSFSYTKVKEYFKLNHSIRELLKPEDRVEKNRLSFLKIKKWRPKAGSSKLASVYNAMPMS